MRIDGHVHTFCSGDSNLSLDDLELVCQKKGIQAVIITDHNEIRCAQLAQGKLRQIKVIVGEEIMTNRGEVTGLFLSQKIIPGLSPEQTMDLIHLQGGLVCIPHPFDRSTGRRHALILRDCYQLKDKIDIVEVFNSRTLLDHYNQQAFKFAKKFNKPMLVGSDAHTKWEVGNTWMEIPNFNSPEEFIQNLREARFIKKKTSPIVFLITWWVRFRKGFNCC